MGRDLTATTNLIWASAESSIHLKASCVPGARSSTARFICSDKQFLSLHPVCLRLVLCCLHPSESAMTTKKNNVTPPQWRPSSVIVPNGWTLKNTTTNRFQFWQQRICSQGQSLRLSAFAALHHTYRSAFLLFWKERLDDDTLGSLSWTEWTWVVQSFFVVVISLKCV